jgi:anoctamin-8
VQFGYVSFFSVAFPLAPLLAVLHNVVELRCDAYKLLHTKQRPLARRVGSIGVWLFVLQVRGEGDGVRGFGAVPCSAVT